MYVHPNMVPQSRFVIVQGALIFYAPIAMLARIAIIELYIVFVCPLCVEWCQIVIGAFYYGKAMKRLRIMV